MPDPIDPEKLLSELKALRAERDAALSALDRRAREAADEQRLLVEEQDRFLSRLLESQESETGRLRLELDEAKTTAERFGQKLERERTTNARLEAELLRVRGDLERYRDQREAARVETRRLREEEVGLRASVEKLTAELTLARSMLADAMDGPPGRGGFTSVDPKTGAHEISRAPRESGIVNRRFPRLRESPTPSVRPRDGIRRSETPRAAAGGSFDGAEKGPPSSR